MMKLLTILLFISVQSYGQIKEFKYSTGNDSTKYSLEAKYDSGYTFIGVTISKPDTSTYYTYRDTVFTNRILRLPVNTNSALLMTKTKFIVRKANGKYTIFDPTGKKIFDDIEVFSYETLEYKTWISL